MRAIKLCATAWFVLFLVSHRIAPALADPATSESSKARVEAALQNMMTLDRPGQSGFATIWDGNKYVQCGRTPDRTIGCEAAGTLMQPSLERVLIPEHVGKLMSLGWRLDPSFGNYAQIFPSDAAPGVIADQILQVLGAAYDANLSDLSVETTWVRTEPCPPRNGPTQNLAGIINDARSMAATAIHACSYSPKQDLGPNRPAASTAELIDFYKAKVTGEIGRLRVNVSRNVFTVFEAGIGYVQCRPYTPPAVIYCEAQSAQSWEALASILTPDRIDQLHAAGFADPGRSPNYWKNYSLDRNDDAAIAREVLTILHDVYGYNGLPKLKIITE
jgi:hypothetical protein